MTQIELIPNRTLSLGDIVGLSFRLVRSHWHAIVKMLLVPSILCSVGTNLSYYSFEGWVKIAAESKLAIAPFAWHMTLCFGGIVLWLYSVWLLFLRSRALARSVFYSESTPQKASAEIAKRRWSVLGAYILTIVPECLVLAFWLVIALACIVLLPKQEPAKFWVGAIIYGFIGFWFTVSMAMATLYGSLVEAVTVIDMPPFGTALQRAGYYLSLRPLRGGSFACLAWVSILLIGTAIQTPSIIATSVFQMVDKGPLPFWLISFNTIFDVLLNMVATTFCGMVNMLFYRDLKLRLEGVDLLNRLEALQSAKPPAV